MMEGDRPPLSLFTHAFVAGLDLSDLEDGQL